MNAVETSEAVSAAIVLKVGIVAIAVVSVAVIEAQVAAVDVDAVDDNRITVNDKAIRQCFYRRELNTASYRRAGSKAMQREVTKLH